MKKGGKILTERHPSSATFKNQSLFILNFRGESHDQRLPEDADATSSEGVLYAL
jgi:hypothetical protein